MPYVIDNEITVFWTLPPTDSPLLASDYDIRIVPPTLEGTYTDAGIINYDPPAADRGGSLQYKFTPKAPGHYHLFLTTGTGAAQTVIDEKDIWAFAGAIGSLASTKVLAAMNYAKEPPVVEEVVNLGINVDAVATDGVDKWVALTIGTIHYSHDNGKTWNTAASVTPANDDSGGYVIAAGGGNWLIFTSGWSYIYHSSDNGVNWTRVVSAGGAGSFVNGAGFPIYDPINNKVVGPVQWGVGSINPDGTGYTVTSGLGNWLFSSSASILQRDNNKICFCGTIGGGSGYTSLILNSGAPTQPWQGGWGRNAMQAFTAAIHGGYGAVAAASGNALVCSDSSVTGGLQWSNTDATTWTKLSTGFTSAISQFLFCPQDANWWFFLADGTIHFSANLSSFTQYSGPLSGTALSQAESADSGPNGFAVATGTNLMIRRTT